MFKKFYVFRVGALACYSVKIRVIFGVWKTRSW